MLAALTVSGAAAPIELAQPQARSDSSRTSHRLPPNIQDVVARALSPAELGPELSRLGPGLERDFHGLEQHAPKEPGGLEGFARRHSGVLGLGTTGLFAGSVLLSLLGGHKSSESESGSASGEGETGAAKPGAAQQQQGAAAGTGATAAAPVAAPNNKRDVSPLDQYVDTLGLDLN